MKLRSLFFLAAALAAAVVWLPGLAHAQETAKKKNKFITFPNTNLPLFLHAMFQGMFAIITVALHLERRLTRPPLAQLRSMGPNSGWSQSHR